MTAPRRTSPTREVQDVADRLHSAALHLLRRLRIEDDILGVSPPRLSALSVVVSAGPLAIGALAAAEGVAAPTMTRLVDGLERDGLVRRRRDPADARGVLVEATPAGKRVLTRGRAQRVQSLAATLASLTPDELAAIARGAELIERDGLNQMSGEAGVFGAFYIFVHSVAAQSDRGQVRMSDADFTEKVEAVAVG